MPVYEYVCRGCEREFEVTLSRSEYGSRKVKCPDCGGRKTDRRWTPFVPMTSKKS